MNVLLVGKGAREHALAVKLAASPLTEQLWLWPANPAALACGLGLALDLPADASVDDVATAAAALTIDLVVCGPEGPLEQGLADALRKKRIPVFGPVRAGAALESSKAFAKEMMRKAGVPTAAFTLAESEASCREAALALLNKDGGAVLKASGLAAGKGVFVCKTAAEVEEGLRHLYHSDMSRAAAIVVVEEMLLGRECSFFTFLGAGGPTTLGFAVDFKRLGDGDVGPNTGGMGCYAPVEWLPKGAAETVEKAVVAPLLQALAAANIDYVGCLYVGLMWGEKGPKVVEFNVRLGDPEAQVLAVFDDRDWLALMAQKAGLAIPAATLAAATRPVAHGEKAVAVVMASPGYPFGTDAPGEKVFAAEIFAGYTGAVSALTASTTTTTNTTTSAGASASADGGGAGRPVAFAASVLPTKSGLVAASGRVLTVAVRARSFALARERAYALVEKIAVDWPRAHYRRDIALRAAKEEGSFLA